MPVAQVFVIQGYLTKTKLKIQAILRKVDLWLWPWDGDHWDTKL